MQMAKKKTVPTIELLDNSFRLEHDGDNYILRTHCSCEGQPHFVGTNREWMGIGVTNRSIDGIRIQIRHAYKMPWSRLLIEALDGGIAEFDLAIPPSPTKRPVASTAPAA